MACKGKKRRGFLKACRMPVGRKKRKPVWGGNRGGR